MQFIKYIFMGIFFVWFLTMASCALVGGGSIMLLDGFSNSQTAKKISRRIKDEELQEHNERANHETYHEHDDYAQEYYDDK